MPGFPFILTGKITDVDGSTSLASCDVIVENFTKPGNTTTTTDANGDYAVDFGNMRGGYAAGDTIRVKIRKNKKVRVSSFTLAQSDIDSGGKSFNLSIYGLRQHIFDTLHTLFSDNLPNDVTDRDGTAASWVIRSARPEDNPSFPIMVLNPAKISGSLVTFDSSEDDDEITVSVEYFSRARFGKQAVDAARDHVESLLLDNENVLVFAGLYFMKPEWLDDSDVGELNLEGEKYNIANQIMKYSVEL